MKLIKIESCFGDDNNLDCPYAVEDAERSYCNHPFNVPYINIEPLWDLIPDECPLEDEEVKG